MSTNPAGWLPLIITSLTAGGAVGAVVTTYGGKSRERRQARSEVIACLQRIEVARLSKPTKDGLLYVAADFAELETKCMIAGVPRELVFLYKTASERWAGLTPSKGLGDQATDGKRALAEFLAVFAFIDRAAELLTEALWHPLLSRPLRHRHTEGLKGMINEVSGRPSEMSSVNTAYRNWQTVTGHSRKEGNE
jgi:hypothetical protein